MARVSFVITIVVLRQKLVNVWSAEVPLVEQMLHTYNAACEYSVC